MSEEVVDLAPMIRGTFESLRVTDGSYKSAKLTFASEIPNVAADPLLMRQALANIVSNSLKFAAGAEPCEIRVGYEKRNGEDVFFFSDNGVGFDMRSLASPFEIFQRMHAAGEFEGSGIGLAIVKAVIAMHEGRVWLTCGADRGVTVSFTLPPDRVLC
jgi:light-regulated signal transduction histidine kinase (bacteriophytochrome)